MFILLWALFLHAAIDLNFDIELQKVLSTHNQAKSYSNWKASNYHPSHQLKKMFYLAKTQDSEDLYCNSLLSLKKIDLYFLESFLEEGKTINTICLKRVQKNLLTFKNNKKQLLNAYSQKHFSKNSKNIDTKELFVDSRGGKILYDGELSDNHFLLTFDDGPHPRVTSRILDTLESYNILSQFFIVGERVQYWPDLIKKTHQQGHIVGNHSWTHPDMRKLNLNEAIDQIESTFNAIHKTIPISEPFFRFPYGAYKFPQLEYLGRQNIVSFFWNIDTYDWKIKDPVELLKFSIKKIKEKNKGIILMHDIHNQTADMLPHLINYLNSRTAQTVIFKTH